MFKQVARLLIVIGLAASATLAASPSGAAAAAATNIPGALGDHGLASCFGAYGTGAAHFVSVQGPIAYAYNQHPKTVDKQRIRMNAVLYRWDGTAWKVAYTPAGAVIQTGWVSSVVSDGQDASFQLNGPDMGRLIVGRAGYYALLFDVRWDATNTVTVSGSQTFWATHYAENGEGWHGPYDYCDYNPREVSFPINF